MGGLRRYLPVTFWTMAIATLAIAGVPPFSGFFSKDEIIGAAWIGMQGASPLSHASLFGISGATWMTLIGIVLSITALITAIYMGRMMIYTFFGPNRTGREEEKHLREVGPTMTVPLIVLAVLTTIGGLFNVEPEVPIVNWFRSLAIGGDAALHHWLHPVIAGAEHVNAVNVPGVPPAEHPAWPIVLAIVIGIGGLAIAWAMLKPERLGDAATEPAYTSPLQRALYNKWYVDEIYGALVIAPFRLLSQAFYWVVDRGIIDGIVDGAARLAGGIGLLVGRLQTGHLNTYAFTIIVGALLVLGAFVAF
jgi:NADH-quinone oxidoreductase subunit L